MKANAFRALFVVALTAGAACAVIAACNLTDGLTGGAPPEVVDAEGCDADLARSTESCGVCGHACAGGPNAFATCVDGGCALSCQGLYGDCDKDPSNGCETNFNSSKTSCGKCGHDCLGGGCTNGLCQPLLLAAGANAPVQILLNDEYVYGVNAFGTVSREPRDGGALVTLVTGRDSEQSPSPRIAYSSGSLYYTSRDAQTNPGDSGVTGAIYAYGLDGGHPTVIAAADDPLAVYATPTWVTWTEGGSGTTPTSSVKRCKVGKCDSTVETPVPKESGAILGIAGDSYTLYWANNGTPPLATDSYVAKCTLPDCVPVILATAPTAPFDVVLDTLTVFWTSRGGNGEINACPIAGCSERPTALATFQFTPNFLVATGTTLYWTNRDGTIRSMAKGTPSTAERIVYEVHGTWPWDIAVDGTAIYWTDLAGNGQPGTALFKLAR